MVTLGSALRTLPAEARSVRRSIRIVKRRAQRLGAGLNPLERALDSIADILDWLDRAGLWSRPRIEAFVWLLRSEERYDEFHDLVLDVAERESRLRRLSSTFKPIQRGRYRPMLASLSTLCTRLKNLDGSLGVVVKRPQDISRRIDGLFSCHGSARIGSRRIRYAVHPAGAMIFGEGMDDAIARAFELGPRGFRAAARTFIEGALSSALPQGTLDRFPERLRIEISSVSGSESSLRSEQGVTLSINALDFVAALFAEDRGALLELIGLTEEHVETVRTIEHPLLVGIRTQAIASIEDCWRKRALPQEYAGVLSVERLELPNHTGSFPSIGDFIAYADESIGRGVQPYFARNVGLHISWVLLCERFGVYRPIGTASIRELAGHKGADGIVHRLIEEMKSENAHGLIHRYALACEALTRAPLIDDS